jgi:two-component system nitrate/nitrite response regulator NarL
MDTKVPIYLVGGSRLFRQGLRSYLDDAAFEFVGEVEHYLDLPRAVADTECPAVVLYANLHGSDDGAQAVRAIGEALPDSHILVMAERLNPMDFGACLNAGVSGYLLSEISKEALLHSLHLILLGEKVFATELAKLWMQHGMERRPTPAPKLDHDLTARESEILHCLLEGHSNKLIARRLAITESTVKIHMKSVLRKINVENRTQAAIWAMETGFGGAINLNN